MVLFKPSFVYCISRDLNISTGSKERLLERSNLAISVNFGCAFYNSGCFIVAYLLEYIKILSFCLSLDSHEHLWK
jgi:hypothetical protein